LGGRKTTRESEAGPEKSAWLSNYFELFLIDYGCVTQARKQMQEQIARRAGGHFATADNNHIILEVVYVSGKANVCFPCDIILGKFPAFGMMFHDNVIVTFL